MRRTFWHAKSRLGLGTDLVLDVRLFYVHPDDELLRSRAAAAAALLD